MASAAMAPMAPSASASSRPPSPGSLQSSSTPMLAHSSAAQSGSGGTGGSGGTSGTTPQPPSRPPTGYYPQAPGSSSQVEDAGTEGHDWSTQWSGSGAAIIVSGGTTSVSTEDLDATAASLTSAATSLDDACTQAQKARAEVNSRPNPNMASRGYGAPALNGISSNEFPYSYGGIWYRGYDTQVMNGRLVTGVSPDSGQQPLLYPSSSLISGAAFPTEPGSMSSWAPGAWGDVTLFELKRATAVAALNNLISGPGGLADAAGALRALASDLLACSEVYARAEGSATASSGGMGPVDMTHFDNALLNKVLGAAVGAADLALAPGTDLYQYILDHVGDDELGLAGVQALTVLLQDPGTEAWVKNDIARLILLAKWLARAETGRESVTIEAYLAVVAQRLDPWISTRLPERSTVGTQTVETTSLTPMQRACLYLGMLSRDSGEQVFGAQTGVSVQPYDAAGPTRIPRPQDDPYGLGTPVAEGQARWFFPSPAPGTISEAVSHGQRVQRIGSNLQAAGTQAGVISIQRTVHADGRVSWVVYVPGTTDWTSGDQEPQDLLTNLEAVAGVPTAMESAVVTAMRQAGIQPGQEVALYGHSQGGITVSNIASDPALQERYHITTVLTAGAPTAGADIPDGVHALHLENGADAVPGLDGAATPTGENRQVAFIDTHQQDIEHYPHGSDVYAQATWGMEETYPEVAPWSRAFASATGAGEAGAQTTEQVFIIQRDIAGRAPGPAQGMASRPADTAPGSRSRAG